MKEININTAVVEVINLKIQELISRPKEKVEKISDFVFNYKDPDYSKSIDQLNQIRDESMGISWTKVNDVLGGGHALIRDARNKKSEAEIEKITQCDTVAYTIQLLNIARAAELLVNTDDKRTPDKQKEAINKIREELKQGLEGLRGNNNKELNTLFQKNVTNFIKILASDLGGSEKKAFKEYSKRLNKAKDYVGFDDQHYSTATIHKIKDDQWNDIIVSELDIALTQVTDNQREEFGNDLGNRPWFKALPEWEQKLILSKKERMIDGLHNCPTQLRGLPFVKNGYQKFTYHHSLENEGTIVNELLDMHFHTETNFVPVHKSDKISSKARKKEEARLANLLKDQLSAIAGPEDIKVFSLLTDDIVRGEERRAVKGINKIFKDQHANMALNIGRIATSNKKDAVNKTLESLGDFLSTKGVDGEIINHLKGTKILNQEAIQAKNNQGNPYQDNPLKEIVQSAAKVRTLMSKTNLLFDPQNRNLQLITEFQKLSNLLRKTRDVKGYENLPSITACYQCKSGKDRTGIFEAYNFSNVIAEKFGLSATKVAREIGSALSAVFHPGISQGGTAGCFGIKKPALTVFPKTWGNDIRTKLVLDAASNNNISNVSYENGNKISNNKTSDGKVDRIDRNVSRAIKYAGLLVLTIAIIGLLTGGFGLPVIALALVGAGMVYLGHRDQGLAEERIKSQQLNTSGKKAESQQLNVEKEKAAHREGIPKRPDPIHTNIVPENKGRG